MVPCSMLNLATVNTSVCQPCLPQVIYGIVIMFTLAGIGVDAQTAGGLFGVGLMTGLALLFSAIPGTGSISSHQRLEEQA